MLLLHLHVYGLFCVTLLLFSHLEEDPLYIAYADMMAKVDRPLSHFLYIKNVF